MLRQALWLEASDRTIDMYMEQVEPKSNAGDGPSVWEVALMHSPNIESKICFTELNESTPYNL